MAIGKYLQTFRRSLLPLSARQSKKSKLLDGRSLYQLFVYYSASYSYIHVKVYYVTYFGYNCSEVCLLRVCVYLLTCGLFNGSVSNPDCSASNGGAINN